jgi:heptosyltransferase-1
MGWPAGFQPRAVLLVRASHLGDVVHALPVFHALRARYASARIGWVVQPEFAGLLRGLPGLDALIPFERARGARAWPPLVRALRAFRAELCVDAQGNLKSAAITRLSRARLRVGLARTDWREGLGHRVLHASAPACDGAHALDRMIGLARWLVGDAALVPRRDPALAPAELVAGRARFDALLAPPLAARPIVLHLSDARDVRGWPAAHWIELVHLLARAGRPTLVISGPAEAALGAEVARAVPAVPGGAPIAHVVGQRGLRELAALLAAAAERGARCVACDSGPLHLACSVDLPTLALAGPQDPRRTGPYPPRAHQSLTSPGELECRPCLSRRCAHARGPVCLSELTPSVVAAACARD